MENFNTSFRLILDIHKGTGFNFLRQSIIVSCSLINHTLETDPVQASHNPIFESKLIWETEKKIFDKLCEQNIPLKIEIKSKGQKQLIGYVLLSLLSAKPCTICSKSKNNHSWHKLLGVKFEGRSSNPQLSLNLISDECADILHCPLLSSFNSDDKKNIAVSQNSKSISSNGIIPRICLSTQTIEIGDGEECSHSFLIQLQIIKYDYFNLLLPTNITDVNSESTSSENYFTLQFFSQILKIEKDKNDQIIIKLNVKSNLLVLSEYFKSNPYAVIKFRNNNINIGVCCLDIRKLIPTVDLTNFLTKFCDDSHTFSYSEKFFVVNTETGDIPVDSDGKKPFIDMEIKFQYISSVTTNTIVLSKAQFETENINEIENSIISEKTFNTNMINADANIEPNGASLFFNNKPKSFESKNDEISKTSLNTEIDAIIEKINSLETGGNELQTNDSKSTMNKKFSTEIQDNNPPYLKMSRKNEILKKVDGCNQNNDEKTLNTDRNFSVSPNTMENVMMEMVNELEDWKECQQELFKSELKEKEEKYLMNLKSELDISRNHQETKLSDNVRQCQNLMHHLREIIENLKKREIHLSERERKLCLAKDEFELYYRKKYSELKDAAKQMEVDYQYQLKLHKFEYSKLEMENVYLKQENSTLKEKLKS